MKKQELELLFGRHNCGDYRWIDPADIVTAQWVRMKCTYGCDEYGRNASCPPNVPPVETCRVFFDEYQHAVLFHFEKQVQQPEDRKPWSKEVNQNLAELERAVFLSGYHKAFVLFMDSCRLCRNCAEVRSECKHPHQSRPGPEAMGVDVFATARSAGYPIRVLKDYGDTMNRYAFLLVE